jgi:hypothetical protein
VVTNVLEETAAPIFIYNPPHPITTNIYHEDEGSEFLQMSVTAHRIKEHHNTNIQELNLHHCENLRYVNNFTSLKYS